MASTAPSPVTVLVWDLPLRLFHWLLVVAVAFAGITGHLGGGFLEWHGHTGLAILGLLAFRAVWGVIGSTHARFVAFFPSPARLRAFLKGEWRGVGHNPLAALAMLAILATTAAQGLTGLFANDDIDYQGPLVPLVSGDFSSLSSWLHELVFVVLLSLVALHLGAIAYHGWLGGQTLVLPMVTGAKEVPTELATKHEGGGPVRFLFAAALASALVWTVGSGALTRQLLPPPPSKPPAGAAPAAW